jgi:hypothetical protein
MQVVTEDLKRAIAQQHNKNVSEYLFLIKSSMLNFKNIDPFPD